MLKMKHADGYMNEHGALYTHTFPEIYVQERTVTEKILFSFILAYSLDLGDVVRVEREGKLRARCST
jgi:hypothetical protein